MKVALVKPPLIQHTARGIGQYTQLLYAGLLHEKNVSVEIVGLSELNTSYDIYHFPYFDPYFVTLPPKLERPSVITIHDMILLKYPSKFPPGIRGKLKWFQQRRRLAHVSAIITDSESSKKDIHAILKYPNSKIFSIYLAPDPIFFKRMQLRDKEALRKKYNLPEKFILFVGEPNWNKNLVAAIASTQKLNMHLVIVSKTFATHDRTFTHPWLSGLRQADEHIRDRRLIHSLHSLETLELVTLYQMADALLYPSYDEGFGLPVTEAFASGCPVLCSNRGSLREVAQDCAQIIDPDDYISISKTLYTVSTDQKRKKELIAKAYKRVKKLSWKSTVSQTLSVYNSIVKNT